MDIEIFCLCLALFGIAGLPHSGVNGLLHGATAALAALLVLAFNPRRRVLAGGVGILSFPSAPAAPAKPLASDSREARALVTRVRIQSMLLG